MDLPSATLVTQGGLVFTGGRVAPLAEDAAFEWIAHLRSVGDIEAAEEHKHELLAALLCSPGVPPLEVPEELTLRGDKHRAATQPANPRRTSGPARPANCGRNYPSITMDG